MPRRPTVRFLTARAGAVCPLTRGELGKRVFRSRKVAAVNDAEPLIDLSAPRHYAQVTPRGRRRRRVAIAGLAAVAVVIAGGAGYAAMQRSAEGASVPAIAPS